MRTLATAAAFLWIAAFLPAAHASTTLCTVIADGGSGKVLQQQGSCTQRITAASTFKIALSLMGYDAGYLTDEHLPALPFRAGYADWLPANGWEVHGKTGTGAPLQPDGSEDDAHAFGWFVGWVSKGDRTLVFVRSIQDTPQDAHRELRAGLRARAAFLQELPALLDSL
jgi:beta-lactamase class D